MLEEHIAENQWRKVLLIPPDITRSHSGAGSITAYYYKALTKRGSTVHILPALGTHAPMTPEEQVKMFGKDIPHNVYLMHDFRQTVTAGIVPGDFLNEISEGLFTRDVPVGINPELLDKSYDAILSIGQVVPHEIAGMANYTKNIVVGCGGGEMIHVSHFLGVFWGLERILGQTANPVRRLFDYIQENILQTLPITFIQTVMTSENGKDHYRGIFIGQDRTVYECAAAMSKQVNFTAVGHPVKTCVVWMDPNSYHSTWVTNKAIYRTQLAVQQGGEIVVIAPGVRMFGENELADGIIRKFGYLPREQVLALCETDETIRGNLSMAGHLIHGCPEGIHVTYCTDLLTRKEIESVNFSYLPVKEALARYPCQDWQTGWQTASDGSEIYYVANAALGLWYCESN